MSITEQWPGLFYDKGGAVFNVKHPDFGAIGGGSTDDTAAIQAAIDAVPSAGGIVYFPAGTYIVSSTLTVNVDNIQLVGAGKDATVIDGSATDYGGIITFGDSSFSPNSNKVNLSSNVGDQTNVRTIEVLKGAANAIEFIDMDAGISITSIDTVAQGGTTYTLTTDYTIVTKVPASGSNARGINNWISWAPGGSEPNENTLYKITYTYITNNSTQVTADSVAGISANDYIAIFSEMEMHSWSRDTYNKGEMFKVKSIAGTTLTAQTPLQDAYQAVHGHIVKLPMKENLVLRDLTILVNQASANIGIDFSYIAHLSIENVRIHGAGQRAIGLFGCYQVLIDGCVIEAVHSTGFINTGTQYGTTILGSQNVTIQNSVYEDAGRHAVSTGERNSGGFGIIIARNIRLDNCTFGSTDNYDTHAVDAHASTDDFFITNCLVYGGMGIASRNFVCKNNTVYSPRGICISTRSTEWMIKRWVIEGNRVVASDTGGVGSVAIKIGLSDNLFNIESLCIKDNRVELLGPSLHGIFIRNTNGGFSKRVNSIQITGNTVQHPDDQTGTLLSIVVEINGGLSNTLEVSNNVVNLGMSIIHNNFRSIIVSDNTIDRDDGLGQHPLRITGTSGEEHLGIIKLTSNSIRGFKEYVLITTGVALLVVRDNVFDSLGSAANPHQLEIKPDGDIHVDISSNFFLRTLTNTDLANHIRIHQVSGTPVLTGVIANNSFGPQSSATDYVSIHADIVNREVYDRNWRNDGSADTPHGTSFGEAGAMIENILTATATFDFGNIADGAFEATTITVTGAALGDVVAVSASLDMPDGFYLSGQVESTNTVKIVALNESGSPVDMGSMTLRAVVTSFVTTGP